MMKIIFDEPSINRSLTRIAHEIIEKNKGADSLILIGIKTRGEFLANRLTQLISDFEKVEVPCVSLDISYWRDDVERNTNDIPQLDIDINNKIVILVDDVLYSGRTCRAAMEGLIHYGRPKEIHLAVLVDRGHRELPIRADYVGKNVPTSQNEKVNVKLKEYDGEDGVYLA